MKFHIFPPQDSASASRTILLFAGWGMDEKPFARINVQGYRLIVVWDYRDFTIPDALTTELETAEEIVVLAWSFGVPAATRFILSNKNLPVTATIAVNGTMHPVDDRLGIPEEIFRGTLDGLTEKSLSKFHLRMCGSSSAFRDFSATLPQRPVDELREELQTIGDAHFDAPEGLWDRAVVSLSDRIIPPDNQTEAWSSEAFETITVAGPHLPDFNMLLSMLLTEKGLVAEKFARAERTYDDNALVQRDIARHLVELIPANAHLTSTLEIGCGTGLTTRLLAQKDGIKSLEVWDLHIPASIREGIDHQELTTRECDAETEIRKVPSESLDLIFSASTMQWFNSPAKFLRECLRALRPGGHAVISTFGPSTMHEINASLPYRRHYPDIEAIASMLPPGATAIHLSTQTEALLFPTPAEALRHAKLTGVNALSSHHSGATARSVIAAYPLTQQGEAPVTYQPIYLVFIKS